MFRDFFAHEQAEEAAKAAAAPPVTAVAKAPESGPSASHVPLLPAGLHDKPGDGSGRLVLAHASLREEAVSS